METGLKAFSGVCIVALFVCPQRNSKTNDPKDFKLGIGNDLEISYKCYGFLVKMSKVKVTGSQVAKNILKAIEWPA